jgi:phage-related minor tail protein
MDLNDMTRLQGLATETAEALADATREADMLGESLAGSAGSATELGAQAQSSAAVISEAYGRAGRDIATSLSESADRAGRELERLKTTGGDAAQGLGDRFSDAVGSMESALARFVTTGEFDLKGLGESLLSNVMNVLLDDSGLFGGGRAAGGPMRTGEWYMVGEQGPELVRAGGAGHVFSHEETSAMLGDGALGGAGGSTAGEIAAGLRRVMREPNLSERARADRTHSGLRFAEGLRGGRR